MSGSNADADAHDANREGPSGVAQISGPTIPSHSQYYSLPSEREAQLRTLYKSLDVNNDGRVDIKDLTQAFKKFHPHLHSSHAQSFMQEADTSRSSDIDFREFVHYILEHERKLSVAFNSIDRNNDGLIDKSELKAYFDELGVTLSERDISDIVDKVSLDDSDKIDLSEFKKFFLFVPAGRNVKNMFAVYWKHNLMIDIGEDGLIPEDFSETELEKGVWWKHLVAGFSAGTVSRTSTAPLDRLKIFLQVHSSVENKIGVRSGLRMLLQEGGLKGFWRGNGVNVMKIAPESAIKFMAYEYAKRWLVGGRGREVSGGQRFMAGACAGAFSQTCIYPLEVLKTRLALRKSGELNKGLFNAAFTIFKQEGGRAFFRGYIPNLIGIIPYAGTDLAVYETLKRYIISRRGDTEPGNMTVLACGTTSSICGQVVSYPFALVRTRLQAKASDTRPQTALGQVTHIWETEGLRGFYRGIAPNFMKVLPAVGISYVVYENVRKQLGVEMT